MTRYTFSDDLVSDLHKDARGFRPSEYFWEEWTQAPAHVKQEIWNRLQTEVNLSIEEDKRSEEIALNKLKSDIKALLSQRFPVADWKEAILQLMAAEGSQELDAFLYNRGIGYSKSFEIETKFKAV